MNEESVEEEEEEADKIHKDAGENIHKQFKKVNQEIHDLNRELESLENEREELEVFSISFEKHVEKERKKVKELTNTLEVSKSQSEESIKVLLRDHEQLSDHLEQLSKKLRIANRHATISKEQEMALVNKHEEIKKLMKRVQNLLVSDECVTLQDVVDQ